MPNIIAGIPLTMEAANMFCGNDTTSQHLRLMNIRLPSLQEQYVDHRPGGAPVAIEVDVIVQRLQCDFTLVGWTQSIMELIYAWSSGQQRFYIHGALRDHNTSRVLHGSAEIFGRLGRVEQASWQRGGLDHCDYSIHAIYHYKLTLGGLTDPNPEVIYNWNFFQNELSIAGN